MDAAAGSSLPISKQYVQGVGLLSFLVSVNVTKVNHTCLATAKTPPLTPGQIENDSTTFEVGDCDYGYINYRFEGIYTYTYLVISIYSDDL